jgi:hypothetical protein
MEKRMAGGKGGKRVGRIFYIGVLATPLLMSLIYDI